MTHDLGNGQHGAIALVRYLLDQRPRAIASPIGRDHRLKLIEPGSAVQSVPAAQGIERVQYGTMTLNSSGVTPPPQLAPVKRVEDFSRAAAKQGEGRIEGDRHGRIPHWRCNTDAWRMPRAREDAA